MTGVLGFRSGRQPWLLSPANASLVRLARRSIRKNRRQSLAVVVLVGVPIGLLTSFVFGGLFRVSAFDEWFSDPFALQIAAFLPLIVGTVVIATFAASVRRRARELGQLAVIGAAGHHLRRLVLFEAAVLVVPGAILFSLVGMAITFLLQPNDESLVDVLVQARVVLVAIPLVFGIAVALLAAMVPARQAAGVSPLAALGSRLSPSVVWVRSWRPMALVVALLLVLRSGGGGFDGGWFFWGVVVVWASFALVALAMPSIVGRIAGRSEVLPMVPRLALRDVGRSTTRAASPAAVALAASMLGVMAVAGMESDRGVREPMDARYLAASLDDVDADEQVAVLAGEIVATADFDDVRFARRGGAGYWSSPLIGELSPDAITAFGLADDVAQTLPAGTALVLDGNDWPVFDGDGNELPIVVVDAGAGAARGGVVLPSILMASEDLQALPPMTVEGEMRFTGSPGFGPNGEILGLSVRLYVAAEPLSAAERAAVPHNSEVSVAVPESAGLFGLGTTAFQWVLIAVFGAAVVMSAVALTKVAAAESDVAIQPMLDMGATPSIRRQFLAMQTGALVLIGGVFGSGLGVVLFWIVTRGDQSVPDPIVPWTAMAVLSFGAALAAAAMVAILFGPKSTRTAES